MTNVYQKRWVLFWAGHPALALGITLLLTCGLALSNEFWLLFPLAILWGLFWFCGSREGSVTKFWPLLHLILAIAAYGYIQYHYLLPETIPKEGLEGTAWVEIQHVNPSKSSFGSGFTYRAIIRKFIDENGETSAKNIPCSILVSTENRPAANSDLLVYGRLLMPHKSSYLLKPNRSITQLPNSWSAAELRWRLQSGIISYLKGLTPDDRVGDFLAGLITGKFSDPSVSSSFSSLGLQHIMAISGFHFSVIAGILLILLRTMLSRKTAALTLLCLLTGYALLLGPLPSVQRAWIAISCVLIGQLLERHSSGLNALGVALLVVLIMDPMAVLNIGFQFSFGITAAILILYRPMERFLSHWIAQYKLETLLKMNRLNQHAYLILSIFRNACGLCLAVTIVSLPVTLFHFGKFPLLSLVYNLFFPTLVSLSLILVVITLLLFPLPFVREAIASLNSSYTRLALDFPLNAPFAWNYNLHVDSMPASVVIITLTCAFLAGILCLRAPDEQNHPALVF